jgi:hypothetical protein
LTPTVTPTPEDIQATAEAQAARDADLMAALQERTANSAPETQSQPTLADNVVAAAELVADLRKKLRLSEATLVKVLELQMQWHWANRQQQQAQQPMSPDFFGDESGGDGEPEAPTAADVHEVITAAPDAEES